MPFDLISCKINALCSIDMSSLDLRDIQTILHLASIASCVVAIILFVVSFMLYKRYSEKVLHNRELYKAFSGVVEKYESNTNRFDIILGRDKTQRDEIIFRLFVDGVERHLTVFTPSRLVKFKPGDVTDLYIHRDLIRTGVSDNANHKGHLMGYNGSSFNGQIWLPKVVNRILRVMIVLGFVLCAAGGVLGVL